MRKEKPTFTNRCWLCGLFRKWEDLNFNFVPDTEFSSEDESTSECKPGKGCKKEKR